MIIRKISVGADYKNAMHYIVGTPVLDKYYTIESILFNEEYESYLIYIRKEDEIMLWKSFNRNLPISVEYNIDF